MHGRRRWSEYRGRSRVHRRRGRMECWRWSGITAGAGGGIPGAEGRARRAAADGILEAQRRARPVVEADEKALAQLKAGERRRPAQMQAGQWPERRASAA